MSPRAARVLFHVHKQEGGRLFPFPRGGRFRGGRSRARGGVHSSSSGRIAPLRRLLHPLQQPAEQGGTGLAAARAAGPGVHVQAGVPLQGEPGNGAAARGGHRRPDDNVTPPALLLPPDLVRALGGVHLGVRRPRDLRAAAAPVHALPQRPGKGVQPGLVVPALHQAQGDGHALPSGVHRGGGLVAPGAAERQPVQGGHVQGGGQTRKDTVFHLHTHTKARRVGVFFGTTGGRGAAGGAGRKRTVVRVRPPRVLLAHAAVGDLLLRQPGIARARGRSTARAPPAAPLHGDSNNVRSASTAVNSDTSFTDGFSSAEGGSRLGPRHARTSASTSAFQPGMSVLPTVLTSMED